MSRTFQIVDVCPAGRVQAAYANRTMADRAQVREGCCRVILDVPVAAEDLRDVRIDGTEAVACPRDLPAAPVAEAQRYLRATDWMVVRAMETGVPVPEDVGKRRAEARAILSDRRRR